MSQDGQRDSDLERIEAQYASCSRLVMLVEWLENDPRFSFLLGGSGQRVDGFARLTGDDLLSLVEGINRIVRRESDNQIRESMKSEERYGEDAFPMQVFPRIDDARELLKSSVSTINLVACARLADRVKLELVAAALQIVVNGAHLEPDGNGRTVRVLDYLSLYGLTLPQRQLNELETLMKQGADSTDLGYDFKQTATQITGVFARWKANSWFRSHPGWTLGKDLTQYELPFELGNLSGFETGELADVFSQGLGKGQLAVALAYEFAEKNGYLSDDHILVKNPQLRTGVINVTYLLDRATNDGKLADLLALSRRQRVEWVEYALQNMVSTYPHSPMLSQDAVAASSIGGLMHQQLRGGNFELSNNLVAEVSVSPIGR